MAILYVGIYLAKNVFALHGVEAIPPEIRSIEHVPSPLQGTRQH